MGICDEKRFAALSVTEREYLTFAAEFCTTILKKRPCYCEGLGLIASALTRLGYYEDGLAYDQRLHRLREKDPTVMYNLACSQALVGEYNVALTNLENAIKLGYADVQQLDKDPDWENVREHPRFRQLVLLAKHQWQFSHN